MGVFNCFRKSSSSKTKSRSWEKSSTSNSTPVIPATQNFSHLDNIIPAEAPPLYTLPAINFPQNTVPRTFSNEFHTPQQSYRPPSIASFTSTIPPHDPTVDDDYGSLREIDTVLLIDDSGSMAACDCRSNNGARISRWEETRTALESMLPIVTKRDPDGIDVYFLNHKSSDPGDRSEGRAGTGYRNITSVKKVKQLFGQVRPSGVTPTGQRIRDILTPYVKHVDEQNKRGIAVKKLNILCITDGVATDNLEEDIVEFARKLDQMGAIARQVGKSTEVQFTRTLAYLKSRHTAISSRPR